MEMLPACSAFVASVVFTKSYIRVLGKKELRRTCHHNLSSERNGDVNDGLNESKTAHQVDASSGVSHNTTAHKKKNDNIDGHHHGNFHEYYTFHNSENRCAPLSHHYFIDIWEHLNRPPILYFLDVGCNEGDLTFQLWQEAQAQLSGKGVTIHAVGIDLDNELIERAKLKYKNQETGVTFKVLDVMETDSLTNVMTDLNITAFSLISCFSVTMWIHMNHGDDGLMKFLNAIGAATNCGVLLEPQVWKSYRKANERCRRRGIPELPHFKKLMIKDVKQTCITLYSKSYGMTLQKPNDETPGWNRPLLLFIK